MPNDVIFRISGPAIEEQGSARVFEAAGYACKGVYKVYAERTSSRLAGVRATPGHDVVAIKLTGGPLLVLHPYHARDLLQSSQAPGSSGLSGSSGSDDVLVTSTLPWTVKRTGLRGASVRAPEATIDWFAILTAAADGVPAEHGDRAVEMAAAIEALQQPGLRPFALHGQDGAAAPGTAPAAPPGAAQTGQAPDKHAYLVFVHGTFVTAGESFRDLSGTRHDSLAELLAQYHPDHVLAFEHPTLTRSPVTNALDLLKALPACARLDLVTHSRGGLIAEILVRAAHEEDTQQAELFDAATKDELRELRHLLREKSITVRKVVRVACPARGTLLASGRLDAWLSVLQWLARVSGIGVPGEWLALLCELARARLQPGKLPGLAAMLPDSALVRWLNAPLSKVDSELYVVAGDSAGDGLQTWIQTLVADAFFWTDNDLVVQTRSMYGGVPRMPGPAGPKYLLAQGGRTTHFTYFAQHDIVRPMVDALKGRPGKEWAPIGPMSWRGRDPGGRRERSQEPAPLDRCRPTVLLIPDVFGSVLTDANGRKLWLNDKSMSGFKRLAVPELDDPGKVGAGIVAARLLRSDYGDLHEHLARTHNVIDLPYDWRLGIDTAAQVLDRKVERLLLSADLGEHPLRIIAHGMGALVVRAWHATCRVNWSRLMARSGVRVVMVGPPNAGSWLPLRLFSGDDTFATLFNSGGTLDEEAAVRETLAGMPGVVQLQAGLSDQLHKLDSPDTWRHLSHSEYRAVRGNQWHGGRTGNGHTDSKQLDRWAIPHEKLLKGASEFWQRLDRALPALLRDLDRIVVVAGTDHATVSGIHASADDLYFVTTDDGDRYVTLDSAALPGAPLYLLRAAHDALASSSAAFAALTELLVRGTTERMKRVDRDVHGSVSAGSGKTEATRLPWHGGRMLSGRDIRELMVAARVAEDGASRVTLQVKVHHGDLRFIRVPLLVGHYKSMTLTGTEAVIDRLLGNRMSKALRAGVYPEREGSFQIFENGRHSPLGRRKQRYIPRPRAAVVVGLGEEGKLTTQILSYTVRIGVIAYAERYSESHDKVASFELAATLVGSGGTGISVSAAALALVQGVTEANMRLREAGWPTVGTLSIVEVYLDRATDAWRVLQMQAESTAELVVEERLIAGEGGLRRPLDTSYRGATYDFISAVRSPDSTAQHPKIAYSLDTRRARTEVRAQQAQGALVRDLILRASNTTRPDRLIGHTLFNLLIPVEIEPYLTGSTDMLMELDDMTATLPWELLDTDPPHPTADVGALQPWAIRSKVLRKLRTEGYRDQVRDAATEDQMLVIGEPLITDTRYGPLPGARAEARAIAEVARAASGMGGGWVTELNDRPNAMTIINALFARNYRIVHIAGHGTGVDRCGRGGGVVLSGEATFLGVNEIEAMRVTPELVFLNCCHLAGSSGCNYDRVAFAAGVATQLIDIGVRCVVAAGWAIEDKPAEVFARTFYDELFSGRRFIDAVGAARAAAWASEPECNTWAAYQCYGDPEWSWKPAGGTVVAAPEEEYAGVASPLTLMLVLETITTELLYTTEDNTTRNQARLSYLVTKFADWRNRGDVAESFAQAFAALPDRAAALKWYGYAVKATDSGASLSSVEMYAEQLSLPGSPEADLTSAIEQFEAIIKMHGKSLRRCSMLGNAYRRLSILLRGAPGGAGRTEQAAAALEQARKHYEDAAESESASLHRFYPLRAALMCKVRAMLVADLDAAGAQADRVGDVLPMRRDDEELELRLAYTLREIQQAVAADPQFLTIVAQTEYEIIKGIVRRNLRSRLKDIHGSLQDLHKRISTRRYWLYVYDDADALLVPYIALMKARPDEQHTALEVQAQLKGYCQEKVHGSP